MKQQNFDPNNLVKQQYLDDQLWNSVKKKNNSNYVVLIDLYEN
jgi:hypothetical protein